MRVRAAWLVGAVLLFGCATGSGSVRRGDPGDAFATPSMECLPGHDESVFTEKMAFAWLLTEQAFELPAPRSAPAGASHQELMHWTETDLARWLEQKHSMVEAARAELNVAAEQSHAQRVWAGALVGLMYEDVARVLVDVPLPRELVEDPEIAAIFREVVRSQANPYLDHAQRAYRACHLNGRQRHELEPWSDFCEDRRMNLPRTGNEDPAEPGTTVEVIRE